MLGINAQTGQPLSGIDHLGRIDGDPDAFGHGLDLVVDGEAGLTQAQVAERMGTQAPAVARLENALVTGKHSPSVATLQKYAAALGKRLEVRFV